MISCSAVSERTLNSVSRDTDKLLRATSYAGVLQHATRLSGDQNSRVTIGSIRKFLEHHIKDDIVDRAINEKKFYDVVRGSIGGVDAVMRYARSGITPKTRIVLENTPMLYQQNAVVTTLRIPTIQDRQEADWKAGLIPVGTQSLFGYRSIESEIEKEIVSKKRSGKGKTSSKKRSKHNDDDDASSSIEEEEDEDGINLMDTDNEEDDDDDDEDMFDKSFIAPEGDGEDDETTSDDEFDKPGSDDVIHQQQETLEEKNRVPEFDSLNVQLHETGEITLKNGETITASHTYTVDGEIGFTSTTTWLGKYMQPFDAPNKARSMVSRANFRDNVEYYAPSQDFADESIRREWPTSKEYEGDVRSISDEKARKAVDMFLQGEVAFSVIESMLPNALRSKLLHMFNEYASKHICNTWTRSSELGTEMHERIEFFIDKKLTRQGMEQFVKHEKAIEIGQFLRWYDNWLIPNNYEPFRVELRIVDKQMGICGSIDALFRHKETGKIIMVDWKRSKGIMNIGYDRVVDDKSEYLHKWVKSARIPGWARKCVGVVASLYDCNFAKYTLQQSVYKTIIERNTNLIIEEMYLLVCHPKQGERYDMFPIEYDKQLIDELCEDQELTNAM